VGSNTTQGMGVCVRVYSVFVLSCVKVGASRRPTIWVKNDYGTEGEARAL
jgi:hypothetical protein